jgi:2-amino-4-hydroxy-6-hydroxymethyldihydropteridine diphosphokinase
MPPLPSSAAAMAEVYLALGSNLGDRQDNLTRGGMALAQHAIRPTARSAIYETEPWGPVPQGRYLNQVLRATTELAPRSVLLAALAIERAHGRDRAREVRFGPRTLDIDILAYDDLTVREADLEIPHPRLLERAFVLVPLAEIAPDLVVNGVRVADALKRLDRSGIARFPGG